MFNLEKAKLEKYGLISKTIQIVLKNITDIQASSVQVYFKVTMII